jgi:hypothetical protein
MVRSDILFYVESVSHGWVLLSWLRGDNNTSISQVQVVQVYSEHILQVADWQYTGT